MPRQKKKPADEPGVMVSGPVIRFKLKDGRIVRKYDAVCFSKLCNKNHLEPTTRPGEINHQPQKPNLVKRKRV